MPKASVRSKVVVLLLMMYCLLLLPLYVGVLCSVLVSLFRTCDNQFSMALPYGAVGWSVLCESGIS